MKAGKGLRAIFGLGAFLLLSGCGSSAPAATGQVAPTSSPTRPHFVLVSSEWRVVSSGTSDHLVHQAANCSLDPATNRQTCIPQPDRLALGSPPVYAAYATVRNDGDAPGTASLTIGAPGTACPVMTPDTKPGSVSEVSCEIGPVAHLAVPPQVTIRNP
jgi:hypothetical protein